MSFVYAWTQRQADSPIPNRKLEGTLVFTAGEVRAWSGHGKKECRQARWNRPMRSKLGNSTRCDQRSPVSTSDEESQ